MTRKGSNTWLPVYSITGPASEKSFTCTVQYFVPKPRRPTRVVKPLRGDGMTDMALKCKASIRRPSQRHYRDNLPLRARPLLGSVFPEPLNNRVVETQLPYIIMSHNGIEQVKAWMVPLAFIRSAAYTSPT